MLKNLVLRHLIFGVSLNCCRVSIILLYTCQMMLHPDFVLHLYMMPTARTILFNGINLRLQVTCMPSLKKALGRLKKN